MTVNALHEPPSTRSVFVLQVRRAGRSLRPELIGLAVIMGGVVFFGLSLILLSKTVLDYPLELAALIPAAAFALPFRLWRGERLFDGADLWTLPVERQKHALLRVAAGAVWIAAMVVVVVTVFNLLALVSNSPTIAEIDPGLRTPGAGEPGLWTWFIPLGSSLVFYLLASGLVLALRQPLRWSVGLLVVGIFVSSLAPRELTDPVARILIHGDLGLARVWNGGPAALWAVALTFWLGVSLAAVALASMRHRER